MAKQKCAKCSIFGCTVQHIVLHKLPASEDLSVQWLHFIYDGNVPAKVGKSVFVCTNHFVSDSIVNLGQYNAGLSQKLLLKGGAVPTVCGETAKEETVHIFKFV